MKRNIALLLLPLMLLQACSNNDRDAGPGGVSTEDAKALDDAAAKLEQENAVPPK
jgi:hypothetical protein